MEKLLMRNEVPVELTWDLTALYETKELFDKDVEVLKDLADKVEAYQGKLTNSKTIIECLELYSALEKVVIRTANYTSLAASVDYLDSKVQEEDAKMNRLLSSIYSRISFIQSEIIELDESIIKEAISLNNDYAIYLGDILREKEHHLSKDVEKTLAALSQSLNVPYEIYNVAKLADMKFDDFTVDGKSYPLGYSLFEDNYEYESNTSVRRAAFDAFSKKIREYENVTGAAYNAQVQYEKTMSTLRGFNSVFDYLLFDQKVSIDLYNRQIDLIYEKLAPHMRKYAKLIQKVHGLDTMTFRDLKLPVDSSYDPRVTIEESKKYIKDGLSILGEDYGKMIDAAYEERWVDFAKNQGKSTGGFCASPYGAHSYILLSWNERMSDVFTLAHELGHAGHFKACNSAQHVFNTNVSSYFVEAPSTCNELIMSHYLLKTSDDPRFKRWVLSCMVSNTYYHNFVTHLLEAHYQREVYRIVDNGGSVNANVLNELKRKTLEGFWGDAVEINEGAELTWMRQPHYYMGLYSYTYSAGLTIATEVVNRIETEGNVAVEDWKKVLAAGSTKTPMELAQMAGVDISTDAPLLHTIETIGKMIDEICELTEVIEKQ